MECEGVTAPMTECMNAYGVRGSHINYYGVHELILNARESQNMGWSALTHTECMEPYSNFISSAIGSTISHAHIRFELHSITVMERSIQV